MKKLIHCLLCAVLGMLPLFGCGSVEPVVSTTEQSSQVKQVVASAKLMSINLAGQDMTTAEYVGTVKYPGQTGLDYSFAKRRKRLDALIENYYPDVLMFQEVNGDNWWWKHLVSNEDSFLNTFTRYSLVGTTNRIGGENGAGDYWYDLYNQLYFNKNKFDLVASGMFYLNENSTEPLSESRFESASYDSDDNATCVWAVLKDKNTAVSAVYASSHLKTAPYLARAITNYRQSIYLADGLYKLSVRYGDGENALPIVVAGDFNMSTDQNYNRTYDYLTAACNYSDAQKTALSSDTKGTARVWGKNRGATKNDGSTSDGYRIDYFFSQGMNVSKYRCLNGMFMFDSEDNVFYSEQPIFDGTGYDLSDHLPIYAEVKVPSSGCEIAAPSAYYVNEASKADKVVDEVCNSVVTQTKITFSGTDLAQFLCTDSQYMSADIVEKGSDKVLRLRASKACANVYAKIDIDGILKSKGFSSLLINNYSRVEITYKTALTVNGSELVFAALNSGDNTINYGVNTTALTDAQSGYVTKIFDVAVSKTAADNITTLFIGTNAYTSDYAGVCGMYEGDCIYISSIEFLA